MRFPVDLGRQGWTGREELGRGGNACPVQPAFSNTFGAARSGGRSHEGVDIFAGRGTTVRAPESGRLTRTTGDLTGRGARLVADAGDRVWTFSHFDDWLGSDGRVEEGAPIGRVGTTGSAEGTCPHLHLELRVNGAVVDPTPLMGALSIQEAEGTRSAATARAQDLIRTMTAIADAWDASGVVDAQRAATTAREFIEAAMRIAAEGRPDAAVEGLTELVWIAEQAPPDWRTPDSLLTRARRLAEAIEDDIEAAATGAAAGSVMGLATVLVLGGVGMYLYLRRR